MKQLIGRKHLIVGNHDGKLLKNPVCKKYFTEIADLKMVNDNVTQIVLCHYRHIHNNFSNKTNQYISKIKNAYNVGVDIIGFMPRTLKEILENQ